MWKYEENKLEWGHIQKLLTKAERSILSGYLEDNPSHVSNTMAELKEAKRTVTLHQRL